MDLVVIDIWLLERCLPVHLQVRLTDSVARRCIFHRLGCCVPLPWQYGLRVHAVTLSSLVLRRISLSYGAGYLDSVPGFDVLGLSWWFCLWFLWLFFVLSTPAVLHWWQVILQLSSHDGCCGPPQSWSECCERWLCDAMRYDIFFILDICTSLGMFCICARLTLASGEEETRNLHNFFFVARSYIWEW